MITSTIFITLLFFMLVTLILTLYFENAAMGGITIILCLVLASLLFPSSLGGVSMQTGLTQNQTSLNYTNTFSQTYSFTSYTSVPLAMTMILIAFYVALQLTWFVRRRKDDESQEEI